MPPRVSSISSPSIVLRKLTKASIVGQVACPIGNGVEPERRFRQQGGFAVGAGIGIRRPGEATLQAWQHGEGTDAQAERSIRVLVEALVQPLDRRGAFDARIDLELGLDLAVDGLEREPCRCVPTSSSALSASFFFAASRSDGRILRGSCRLAGFLGALGRRGRTSRGRRIARRRRRCFRRSICAPSRRRRVRVRRRAVARRRIGRRRECPGRRQPGLRPLLQRRGLSQQRNTAQQIVVDVGLRDLAAQSGRLLRQHHRRRAKDHGADADQRRAKNATWRASLMLWPEVRHRHPNAVAAQSAPILAEP